MEFRGVSINCRYAKNGSSERMIGRWRLNKRHSAGDVEGIKRFDYGNWLLKTRDQVAKMVVMESNKDRRITRDRKQSVML